MQLFKDKNVNDLVFAIIIGFSTVEFIYSAVNVIGVSYTGNQGGASTPIQWHQLLLFVIGYVISIIVALIIRRQISTKTSK